MLSATYRQRRAIFIIVPLLIFISGIPFPMSVAASDFKKKQAEEYRAEGYVEQQRGNFEQAASLYARALALGQEDAVLLNDMGVVAEQLGFKKRAESYYLQALKMDETCLPAYANLAYLYKAAGKSDKAFIYFKKRYELSAAGDLWADKARDEMLAVRPDMREWVIAREMEKVPAIQRATEDPADLSTVMIRVNQHYKKGKSLEIRRKYAEAIAQYDAALALTPDNQRIIDARLFAQMELNMQNGTGAFR